MPLNPILPYASSTWQEYKGWLRFPSCQGLLWANKAPGDQWQRAEKPTAAPSKCHKTTPGQNRAPLCWDGNSGISCTALNPCPSTTESHREQHQPGACTRRGSGGWDTAHHGTMENSQITPQTALSSIHCLLSDYQYSFCFLFTFSHTMCKKQTMPNFPCFSSHYWNFSCSSLILISLRYEHSQKQASSSKLDRLNYWKFTKGKGNKDLKHLLDFSLPQISSLFIQIIKKQAEGCNYVKHNSFLLLWGTKIKTRNPDLERTYTQTHKKTFICMIF